VTVPIENWILVNSVAQARGNEICQVFCACITGIKWCTGVEVQIHWGVEADAVSGVFEGSSLRSRSRGRPQVDVLLRFPPVCLIVQNRWDLRPSSPNLPSHEIQQLTHATRPGRSLRTCSTVACTFVLMVASSVLCSSTNTDISFPFYKDSCVDAVHVAFPAVAVLRACDSRAKKLWQDVHGKSGGRSERATQSGSCCNCRARAAPQGLVRNHKKQTSV